MSQLAPICLFTFNRLDELKKTVTALQRNILAKESELYIFSDGWQKEEDKEKVLAVRCFLEEITGFKKVIIFESHENKGLADSIINGVTKIINRHKKVIVVEDDLYTTPNFLSYMNQALEFYKENDKIISICGYGLKIKRPKNYESDFYLFGRSSSWGWGTWKHQWDTVDWSVKDWETFKKNKKAIKAFKYYGSDMFTMLKNVIEGKDSSWAIRFAYSQFKQNKYSLMPFKSKVENQGFGSEATNTKYKFSRFKTELDPGHQFRFNFDKNIGVNKNIEKQCFRYHSLSIRIYSRIRYILGL